MVELTLLKQQQKSVPIYKEYGDLKIEKEQIQEREDWVESVGLKDPVNILYLIKFSLHLRSSYNYVHYTNAETDTWKLKTISC